MVPQCCEIANVTARGNEFTWTAPALMDGGAKPTGVPIGEGNYFDQYSCYYIYIT